MTSNKTLPLILGAFAVVILGVGSAWLITNKMAGKGTSSSVVSTSTKSGSNEQGALVANVKYDDAVGDLKEGGINGEGTFHLERDGGPSHFVYLTSSTVDLSAFVGKKVQVWGQTLASKKAGWLMDVAKIKVQ